MQSENNYNVSDQLFLLLKLGKKISTNTDLNSVLNILGDTARDIIHADRCSIFIYDKENDELWTKVAHGVDEIRVCASSGVVGSAALSQEVQIVVDAYNDFRFNKEIDMHTGYVTHDIIAVPLLNHKNETIGVFQALNKKDGVFNSVDAELLILIGNYASVSLENALLYSKLQSSQTKIINTLSEVAEFKDAETSAHTKRVGLYTQIIARELGQDEEFCNLIKLTSPMHDIGKIGIPDGVLLKPGKLTPAEFTVMKNHANIGFDILNDKEDEILQMAARISQDHHEKYCGGGYPNNKKGDEISIEGRITALADVFDALTSKRPYKEAWDIDKAIELISSERGKQFDPQVVDAFLRQVDVFIEIKKEFKDS